MIETCDISYDPFALQIVPLKELRDAAPEAKHTEIERIGYVLKNLKKSKNPKDAGKLAWRAKSVLENYNPSKDAIKNDAEYLLRLVQPKTLFCMFEMVEPGEYVRKHFPEKYKITYACKNCFYDENFSEWIRGRRKIETVAELVDYALALEDDCSNKKQSLSAYLTGSSENVLDGIKKFAEVSLLTESMKAIANTESVNVWFEMNRKLKGGREIGFGKPEKRKVYTNDSEVRNTRKTISERIRLRRLGLGDAADELDVRIVRVEDLIIPEPLQA